MQASKQTHAQDILRTDVPQSGKEIITKILHLGTAAHGPAVFFGESRYFATFYLSQNQSFNCQNNEHSLGVY